MIIMLLLFPLALLLSFNGGFSIVGSSSNRAMAVEVEESSNSVLAQHSADVHSTSDGDDFTNVYEAYKLALSQQIVCTKLLSCSEYHRMRWLNDMAEVRRLINRSKTLYMSYRSAALCRDVQSAGFLLDEKSVAWPMACLWTGSDGNGSCAPAPPSNRVIDYVVPEVWRHKLKELRTAIRCSPEEIAMADEVDELYICRKRCTESGVGYLPSLIMAASVLAMLALLIGDEP